MIHYPHLYLQYLLSISFSSTDLKSYHTVAFLSIYLIKILTVIHLSLSLTTPYGQRALPKSEIHTLYLFPGDWVQLCYQAGDAGNRKGGFDIIIIVLFTDEGQQAIPWAILVLLHNLLGYGVERDDHRATTEMKRLRGDVLKAYVRPARGINRLVSC